MKQTAPSELNPSQGERLKENAHLTIAFVEHSPGNFDQIFERIAQLNPDIIACEQRGGTSEIKQAASVLLTEVVASPENSRVFMKKHEHDLSTEPMLEAVLKHFSGSGVQFEFIDVTDDDPGYELSMMAQSALSQVTHRISEGNSMSRIKSKLDLYLDIDARANERRESVMASQLHQIVKNNPDKKIVAMVGADHTPIFHELKDLSTDRIFIPGKNIEEQLGRLESMRYPALDRASRARRFGKAVTDKHLNQVVDYLTYGTPDHSLTTQASRRKST
jgi:hypothetical protein